MRDHCSEVCANLMLRPQRAVFATRSKIFCRYLEQASGFRCLTLKKWAERGSLRGQYRAANPRLKACSKYWRKVLLLVAKTAFLRTQP